MVCHAEPLRSIAVRVVLLSTNIHLLYVFHLFLPEKGGAKKLKANSNGSACFAAHAEQQSLQHSPGFCFMGSSLLHYYLQLFKMFMPFLQV
jgi:hypothetical protein